MIRLLRSEWLKLRGAVLWILLGTSPFIAAIAGLLSNGERKGLAEEDAWIALLGLMAVLHAILFLPLLTGVFSALVCRYEHISGGWKQLLSLPVTRTKVYFSKYIMVMLLTATVQLLFLILLLAVGKTLGFEGAIPWKIIFGSIAGGFIACLPLAALQLAVSTAWSSFAAPMAINVIFTLPNMLIVNSAEFGPLYPWAQPVLAMLPTGTMEFGAFHLSMASLFGTIGGSFVLFATVGWTYFTRKAI